mmetsp:Transcript_26581/g.85991  ORF Transcript_26581/g.85991 Transcript_26581/m.85991 type:complete len:325 (+) Transcript_26581:307-1281(+)
MGIFEVVGDVAEEVLDVLEGAGSSGLSRGEGLPSEVGGVVVVVVVEEAVFGGGGGSDEEALLHGPERGLWRLLGYGLLLLVIIVDVVVVDGAHGVGIPSGLSGDGEDSVEGLGLELGRPRVDEGPAVGVLSRAARVEDELPFVRVFRLGLGDDGPVLPEGQAEHMAHARRVAVAAFPLLLVCRRCCDDGPERDASIAASLERERLVGTAAAVVVVVVKDELLRESEGVGAPVLGGSSRGAWHAELYVDGEGAGVVGDGGEGVFLLVEAVVEGVPAEDLVPAALEGAGVEVVEGTDGRHWRFHGRVRSRRQDGNLDAAVRVDGAL